MASVNPYRYAGYRYDESTGLYYLMARYYDAGVGRFITRDSFHGFVNDPLSLNQYSYTQNNPINYVDPKGHWRVGSVDTVGNWIDAALIAISYAMGFGSAVAAIKQGGAAFAKKVGIRIARRMAQESFKKACWFLSAGMILTITDVVITAAGLSVGKLAAMYIDKIDAKRNDGYVDI